MEACCRVYSRIQIDLIVTIRKGLSKPRRLTYVAV
jgi:hypothetical protein